MAMVARSQHGWGELQELIPDAKPPTDRGAATLPSRSLF